MTLRYITCIHQRTWPSVVCGLSYEGRVWQSRLGEHTGSVLPWTSRFLLGACFHRGSTALAETSPGVGVDMGGAFLRGFIRITWRCFVCLSVHLLFKLSTLQFQVLKGLSLRRVEGPSENHWPGVSLSPLRRTLWKVTREHHHINGKGSTQGHGFKRSHDLQNPQDN